ncbi:cell division protein FtsX [Pelomonas saccharophila]|uniref:Cell division protein FtsX n=1 Tax=Roseateles saccharophilus TaxID=304 RepID=A0ABU1YPM0_ROSSA|nr:FtsX-like permease family protein [Roseateles saccharophilus]MDR7270807.1 cell division protein FtsX [Roseateles saccharophilus]
MTLLSSPTFWRGAWRQLRAEPGPAALVIAGLALGLALALLTASFLQDTLWPDGDLPQRDRLVAFEWQVRGPGGIKTEWMGDVPTVPLQAALRESGAPMGLSSRVLFTQLPSRAADAGGRQRSTRLSIALADADVQALFGMRPLAGDLTAALSTPEGIALTAQAAERLFGTAQALGRNFTIALPPMPDGSPGGQFALTVKAVLPTPNPNGTLVFDAIAGFQAPAAKAYLKMSNSWYQGNGRLFARLLTGATPDQLSALAQRVMERQPLPPGFPTDFLKGGGKPAYLRAMPVADIGLHGAGSPYRRRWLGGLGAATAGVLVLAVINFVNLWSVRTLRRQREIGLRKSLGADAPRLAQQFFVEAAAVAGLGGLFGLLLAWWAMPLAEVLMQRQFHAPVVSAATVALTAVLCLAIAALSALPLTSIALRVRPAESLAGRSHSEGAASRWLRRLMTTLQFGAAAVFASLALTVLWQAEHAGVIPRGFDVQDRVAIDLPWEAQPAELNALLAGVRSWPEVIAASAADDVPGRDFSSWYGEFKGPGGQSVSLRIGVDFLPGYLQTYGMHVVVGRLSADHAAEVAQHAIVLDRSAVRALGFASPEAAVGQLLAAPSNIDGGRAATVVAVIDDIRLEGPRSPPQPHGIWPQAERAGGAIGVHSRDPQATRAKLTALVKQRFPDADAQALPMRDMLLQKVVDDARLGRLIGIAGLLALGLAAVGIYALAAYTLRRREREIVLRKLHGAGAGAVAGLLAREFAGVLAVAWAVALPLAAWMSQRYLADFVERAPVGPFSLWVLLAAVALLAAVTALAVARHLHAALALRPLQALRG